MKNETLKIGSEVLFNNAEGVCEIIAINGKTATLKYLYSGEILKKRLTSLKEFKPTYSYWNEQERAEGQAKHNHGDVVYTCLSGDGNGCKILWDDINKTCVDSKDFVK